MCEANGKQLRNSEKYQCAQSIDFQQYYLAKLPETKKWEAMVALRLPFLLFTALAGTGKLSTSVRIL